jgi:hypothetical protein
MLQRICALLAFSLLLAGCTGKVIVTRIPGPPSETKGQPAAAGNGEASPTGGNGPAANVKAGSAANFTKTKVDGVVYALPRSVIGVQAKVVKTWFEKGKYCECGKLLDPVLDTTLCAKAEEKYSVEGISLSSRGEPDPKQVFQLKVTGGWRDSRNANLEFGDLLVLTNGEAETTNHSAEVVGAALEVAGGLIAKAIEADQTPGQVKVVPACVPAQETRAREALDEIRILSRQREEILRNLATSGLGEHALGVVKELEARIAEKAAEFGRKPASKTVWKASFDVRPARAGDYPLFAYSESEGVCQDTASSDVDVREPYPHQRWACGDRREVFLAVRSERQIADVLDGDEPPGKDLAFRYRIPALALVRVVVKAGATETQLARADIPVAQLGVTVPLPASTGGSRTRYKVGLHPEHGALKSFVLGSDAVLRGALLKSAGAAAGTVLDAKAAAGDELKRLQRERAILEERKKIRDLSKEMQGGQQ